jgi:hypothetical protein
VRLKTIGLIAVLTMGLQACGDYSVHLPGGYSLTRIYAGAILINKPGEGIIIDANIDAYAVVGSRVVGHVTASKLAPEKQFSKPGFFILNTAKGEALQGLDKQTWIRLLKDAGIDSEPSLHKPSRFDRNYE